MSITANLGFTLLEEAQSGKATTINVAFTAIDAAIGASGTTIQAGITTSTTLTNQNVVLADATSAVLTVTLPASPVTGQSVIVKKVDSSAHAVTVAPSSGTIDGAATLSLSAQNQAAMLVYTASGWKVGATAGVAASGALLAANNLGDVASASTARANLGLHTHEDEEVPSGAIDGVNATFTLAHAPLAGTLKVFLDGIRQKGGTHFTVSGTTLTMTSAPEAGMALIAEYDY